MLSFKGEAAKKAFSAVIAAFLLLSIAGCGEKKDNNSSRSSSGSSTGISANDVDTSDSKIANKDFGG